MAKFIRVVGGYQESLVGVGETIFEEPFNVDDDDIAKSLREQPERFKEVQAGPQTKKKVVKEEE